MTNYAIRQSIETKLAIAAVCLADARRANLDELPNLAILDLSHVPRLVEEAVVRRRPSRIEPNPSEIRSPTETEPRN